MQENNKDPCSRYKVHCLKSNKDKIKQPRCVECGVLPKLPFGLLCVGTTGSGKTVATINMLTNPYMLKEAFDYIILWCGVKPDENFVDELGISRENINVDFTEEQVASKFNKLEHATEKSGKDFSRVPKVLFIFDDILNKPKFMKSPTMIKIATAHRHANLSYILLSQYYKKVQPTIRTNVHGIMFFPASLIEVEKLAEENTPPDMTKKEFISVVQHATNENHSFLFINKRAKRGETLRKNFDMIIE